MGSVVMNTISIIITSRCGAKILVTNIALVRTCHSLQLGDCKDDDAALLELSKEMLMLPLTCAQVTMMEGFCAGATMFRPEICSQSCGMCPSNPTNPISALFVCNTLDSKWPVWSQVAFEHVLLDQVRPSANLLLVALV